MYETSNETAIFYGISGNKIVLKSYHASVKILSTGNTSQCNIVIFQFPNQNVTHIIGSPLLQRPQYVTSKKKAHDFSKYLNKKHTSAF